MKTEEQMRSDYSKWNYWVGLWIGEGKMEISYLRNSEPFDPARPITFLDVQKKMMQNMNVLAMKPDVLMVAEIADKKLGQLVYETEDSNLIIGMFQEEGYPRLINVAHFQLSEATEEQRKKITAMTIPAYYIKPVSPVENELAAWRKKFFRQSTKKNKRNKIN